MLSRDRRKRLNLNFPSSRANGFCSALLKLIRELVQFIAEDGEFSLDAIGGHARAFVAAEDVVDEVGAVAELAGDVAAHAVDVVVHFFPCAGKVGNIHLSAETAGDADFFHEAMMLLAEGGE